MFKLPTTLISVTVIEIAYVVYMLRFFKTRYSLAHPLVKFNSEYLKHPIGKFENPQSTICDFGKDGALIIAFLLLLRLKALVLFNIRPKTVLTANKFILFIIGILSLMNFNALVYLLPFFLCEIVLIKNLYYY
tara:strand:+ start:670 stop:1068 length:399 start_codon:yes stop_codon:yes gene_type:complete